MARSNLGLVTFLSLFAVLPSAHAASIADCGNINVEASAQCNVVPPSATCEGQCTIPSTCSAKLYGGCKGQCTATLPSCETSCSATCEGNCSASANFDCTANCNATCKGDCSGTCQSKCQANNTGADCQAQCEGTCKATCEGECSASCSGNAQASCQGTCAASCQGSCNGQARLDCQLNCSPPSAYVTCNGGCTAECKTQKGALFCDGNYVDYNNNLDSCLAAIKAALPSVTVTYSSSASSGCDGGVCTAEGHAEASASCAMVRLGSHKGAISGLVLLGAALLCAGVRRRRQ